MKNTAIENEIIGSLYPNGQDSAWGYIFKGEEIIGTLEYKNGEENRNYYDTPVKGEEVYCRFNGESLGFVDAKTTHENEIAKQIIIDEMHEKRDRQISQIAISKGYELDAIWSLLDSLDEKNVKIALNLLGL